MSGDIGVKERPMAPLADHPRARGALVVFSATMFLSAFLLFAVQPMFAKMVLPVLGGSPSVWAVALCFFQGALLAGYGYAHALNSYVPLRTAGILHIALCLLAFLALPIALPDGWREPPTGEPYMWQLGLFTVAIGLPFVAVAANAPLLQAWFARAGGAAGRDPYFLYAASNLGSLIALLGYPFVLEPAFGLTALSGFWTLLYGALVAAIAGCFMLVRAAAGSAAQNAAEPGIAAAQPDAGAGVPPTARQRLGWIGLAFVPSGLLTAFTTHVATDVASAPLIWVIPLALYLLSFVLVFRERPIIPPKLVLAVHLLAILGVMLQLSQTKHDGWVLSATAGVMAFLTSTLVAHRTLYEARPNARYLTEFYLWMSFGGVLGGLFAGLIAPKIFSEVLEYPLLLALTMACRPDALGFLRANRRALLWTALVALVGGLLVVAVPLLIALSGWDTNEWGVAFMVVAALALLCLALWKQPVSQLVLVLAMCVAVIRLPSDVRRGDAQRSYFGVYRVMLSEDGQFNVLTHGTTLHGAQRVRNDEGEPVADTTPGTYYHPGSPMAEAVEFVRAAKTQGGAQPTVGVVGLGAGSLACHSKPGETWRFFEIDPTVVRIATSKQFTYLRNCQPKPDIVLGDARLTIAKQPDRTFDLIIVDAFSSDAIPVHLLTAEALRLYEAKIKDDGMFVLHVSNRYLDLESVLSATMPLVPDLKALVVEDGAWDNTYAAISSTIVVFAKDSQRLDPFRTMDHTSDLPASRLTAWTDDASDILGPFLAKLRK
jgi:hypothetical protein